MLKIALCLCVVVVAVHCGVPGAYGGGAGGYGGAAGGYGGVSGAYRGVSGAYGGVPGAYGGGSYGGAYGGGRHSGAYIPDPLNAAYPPIPFSFDYVAPATGGSSSRTEQGDGNGRVTGSYTINDADGRSRVVNYVADAAGFRAQIETNEPGTLTSNAADAIYRSNAPAVVYGPPSGGYLGAASTAYKYGAAAGVAGGYKAGAYGAGAYGAGAYGAGAYGAGAAGKGHHAW